MGTPRQGRTCGFKHTYNQAKIDSAVYEIVSNLSTHPVFEEALAKAYDGDESVEAYEKRMRSIRKDLYHQEHEKKTPRCGTGQSGCSVSVLRFGL